jgi:predicted nuclease of restriction endonuclease-like (RecB) superfamily
MSKIVKKVDTVSPLYERILELITQARKTVVQNINHTMVYTYFEIGRVIVEDEQKGNNKAEYGEKILADLSKKLVKIFDKGFSLTNLKQMRYFYITYAGRISQTVSSKSSRYQIGQTVSDQFENQFKLSWSHYIKLMRIDDEKERKFYEIECFNNGWSLREFERQFNSALYERLALSKDKEEVKALSVKGQIIEKPEDAIKDPYILEFTGLPELAQYSETELEQKLIDKLESFLLELGKGFTFVGRQVRFTFDEQHFRVDLVFYNRILKCFVLIDLKIGKLTHQDLGQMQMYVNYYDRFVKLSEENQTIGIVLCRSKNEMLVEITLPENNKTIFASQYKTILPSKTDLKKLLEDKDVNIKKKVVKK